MSQARLDAFQLAGHLHERLVSLTVSEHYLRNPGLLEIARSLWSSGQDGLLSELWVEASVPPRSSGTSLAALVAEGHFPAELARQLDDKDRVPSQRLLHSHQAEAILAAPAQDGAQPTLMITAGTGAGKTETFLLPLLNHLWSRPRSGSGVRAIILYPMNALVNDQLDRLDRWLQGQERLRLCRFTSETPEDRAAAQARGLKLGDRHRLHTRAQARGLEDHTGRTVAGERLSPPDILITNYSMLEYMLARPQDQVLFGSGLQTLVLDEAHLYTGTLAAELALLLRRLYLRCGREPGQVLTLATSATIGSGSSGELVSFGATLFSREPSTVKVIQGQDAELVLPAAEPPVKAGALEALAAGFQLATIRQNASGREELLHNPKAVEELAAVVETLVSPSVVASAREECQGFPARFLHYALTRAPLVQKLSAATRAQRYQSLGTLSSSLFDSQLDSCRQATVGLLSLVAAARESVHDMPLLPHRLHLLFRPSANLTMCLNDACPRRGEQIQKTGVREVDDPLPWGPLVVSDSADCPVCQGPALTLVRCQNCGQEALASVSATRALPLRAGQLLRDVPRVQAGGGPKQPVLWGRPGQGERDWSIAGDARVFTPASAQHPALLSALNRCPHCQAGRGSFGRLQTARMVCQSVAIEALLAELPPLAGDQNADLLPARGRRLLAFSDSRSGAARLGPVLRNQHETKLVRAALAGLLETRESSDPGQIQQLEETIQILRERGLPGQVALLEQNLQTMKAGRPVPEWVEQLRKQELLAELFDPRKGETQQAEQWNEKTWLANREAAADPETLYGRLALELAIPLRGRFSTLESVGLVEITYPGLAELEAPPELLGSLESRVRQSLQRGWTELLATLLDTLRRDRHVTLGSQVLDRQFYREGYPFGLWCSRENFVGRTQRKARRQFVSNVLQQADLEPAQADERASDILEAAFDQLFGSGRPAGTLGSDEPGRLACLEANPKFFEKSQTVPAIRLRFRDLALRKPASVYRCRLTGRLWPRQVNGCAPTPGSVGTLEEVSQAELDQWAPAARARQEYRHSPVFRIGLWAEEHSAQLSAPEAQRLQELFRRGMRNLLSSTTTMELGIDIGGLSAAFLANVPPGKANYLQRAGRVGRRSDGSSVVVTFAQQQPFDREVFRRFGDYLARALKKPTVFLQRERLARRHFHAWLMGQFFAQLYRPEDVTGAMSAFGRMGPFCGVQSAPVWKSGPKPGLIEAPPPVDEPPAWWPTGSGVTLAQAYRHWIAHVGAAPALHREALERLFAGTPYAGQDWTELFSLAQEQFDRVRSEWLKDYAALLESWTQASQPRVAAALRYRLDSLSQTTVIEALGDAQYLPRYGFPIGLQKLLVQEPEGERKRRPGREDRYRLERASLLALREYVPGSQLMVGGRVITSRGLLRHHAGANVDVAFGTRGQGVTCEKGHFFYWTGQVQELCPLCQAEPRERAAELLFPKHGFATAAWDPPVYATEIERVGSVRLETVAFARPGEDELVRDFGGLSGVVARYREQGEILVVNHGDDGLGFAICTRCGYSEVEEAAGEGRVGLSRSFLRHVPLFVEDPKAPACWRQDDEAPALRHQWLAGRETTDTLLLTFNEVRPAWSEAQILTLGEALRLAGARHLELDDRELGMMTVPTEGQDGLLLYDNVPGGAGHVLELLHQAPDWLEQAAQQLYLDEAHHARCQTACLDCLLSFSFQELHGDRLDRRATYTRLRKALAGHAPG